MHKHLMGDLDTEIVYCTNDIYTKEIEFIYFPRCTSFNQNFWELSFPFWIWKKDKIHMKQYFYGHI